MVELDQVVSNSWMGVGETEEALYFLLRRDCSPGCGLTMAQVRQEVVDLSRPVPDLGDYVCTTRRGKGRSGIKLVLKIHTNHALRPRMRRPGFAWAHAQWGVCTNVPFDRPRCGGAGQ